MEIKQLEYFISVIENDYNISKAATSIHLSQSALSQMIKNFEDRENIRLFERHKGRLVCLTDAGEALYENAKIMISTYEKMMSEIRNFKSGLSGEVIIGIPHLIISTVFSELISDFKRNHPNIELTTYIQGGYEVQKKLLNEKIDIAITLKPTPFDPEIFDVTTLIENELCAFVDTNHQLSNKDFLTWQDFHNKPLAIFDKGHMIHELLTTEFKKQNVKPNILIYSNYYDFILRSTFKTDIITILPAPVYNYISTKNIKAIPIKNPIKWQIVMCKRKDKKTKIIDFVSTIIAGHFDASY